MSVPITYLELLQTKTMPNAQQEIKINFNKEHHLPESNYEETSEKLIVDENIQSKPFTILDKRRSSTINRDIIMEKLRKQDVFAVKPRASDIKTNIYIPKDIPTPIISESEIVSKMDEPIILAETLDDDVEETETTEDEDIFNVENATGPTEPDSQTVTRLTELEEPAKLEKEIIEEKVD